MKQFCIFTRRALLFIFFCCTIFSAKAQTIGDSMLHICGVSPDYFAAHGILDSGAGSSADSLLALNNPIIPDSGIFTCGAFRVYYEDFIQVGSSPLGGFADQTIPSGYTVSLGYLRRRTFCDVLTYIQSLFDFSHIPSGSPIRIHVQRSYYASNPAPVPTFFTGQGSAQFNASSTGIAYGFVRDYTLSGTDPAPGYYHGDLLMNFDKTHSYTVSSSTITYYANPVVYQNDDASGIHCALLDLRSVLQHEMTHILGWFSLISFAAPTALTLSYSTLNNVQPTALFPHLFSALDSSVQAANVYTNSGVGISSGYPLTFTPLLVSSPSYPSLNSSTSVAANNNYWINKQQPPQNHAVFSGLYNIEDFVYYLPGSYLSHMDYLTGAFSSRHRVSPGELQHYVMSPLLLSGDLVREYTKGEIETIHHVLGYGFNTTPSYYSNHTPFSGRMASYPFYFCDMNNGLQTRSGVFPDSVAAQASLTNNTGSSYTLNLNDPAWGFTDADGDSLSVYPGSLVNFRGSGNGNNNHNCLTVSATAGNTDNVISYTPRANYWGRTQFGLNLYDGKEKGSFVLFTIDVIPGTNVSISAGSNIVLNGGFEEGSEVRMLGSSASESIPNAVRTDAGNMEGKLGANQYSDSHPFCNFANGGIYGGTIIDSSYWECGTSIWTYQGWPATSFGTTLMPLAASNGGKRYQFMWGNGFSFYNMGAYVSHCKKYILEFDAIGNATFKIGFTNNVGPTNYNAPVLTYNFNFPFVTGSSWQHFTDSFWYCAADSANVLYFNNLSSSTVVIDNISLKQIVHPAALSVSIAKTVLHNCTSNLTANASNTACDTTYYWSNNINSAHPTTQTINVPTNVTANYWVIVSDGCRSDTDTIIITAPILTTPSISASGSTTFCIGGSVLLSCSPNSSGYHYQWYNGSTPISGAATYTYTASVSGTYTVQIADTASGCYVASNSITVTVNPLPVISSQPANLTMCAGSANSFGLSATGTGLSYQWYVNQGSGFVSVTNGGVYSGATTATLSITGATTAMNGYTYKCVVSNTYGCSVTSNIVTLTVNPGPSLSSTLSPSPICSGSIFNYTPLSTVTGTAFSWTRAAIASINGNTPGSGTGSISETLTSTSTSTVNVTYVYTLNASGCINTQNVVVGVIPRPAATLTPAGPDTLCVETDTLLLSANTGSGLSYKWLLNGSLISGATSSTYQFSMAGLSTTTTYTIKVIVNTSSGCPDTSAAVLVTVLAGNCGCSVFRKYASFKTISGTMAASSFVTGQNYYVNGDMTLSGNGTLNTEYIAVGDHYTIHIGNSSTSANVIIDNSHLWACGIAWDGISLYQSSTYSGYLTLQHNTLIEDALIGVSVVSPVAPGSGYVLSCDSTIFNQDSVGVYIQDYSASSSSYPFRFRSNVFTSRGSIANPYNVWVGAPGLWAGVTPANPLTAPFKLNTTYNGTNCPGGNPAYAGIVLNRVGTTSSSGGMVFYGITIGDTTQTYYLNLFDTLQYGILAINANMIVQNNVFINESIDGINAATEVFKGRLWLPYTSANKVNQFWSCRKDGINLSNYYRVNAYQAKMVGSAGNTGYGIRISETAPTSTLNNTFDTIDIRRDSLCNIWQGVLVSSITNFPTPAYPGAIPSMLIRVNSNTIIPNYLSATGVVRQAISIQNSTNSSTQLYGYHGYVHADSNTIDANNGIYFNGIKSANTSSTYNLLTIEPNSSIGQYGINHTGCPISMIVNNNVGGYGSLNTIDTSRAVFVGYGSNSNVHCNTTNNFGRGFEFAGPNTGSKWLSNTMTLEKKGFVLNWNGVTGKLYYQTGDSVIGDDWAGSSSYWAIPSTNYQTYTQNGSLAKNSPMYVKSGTGLAYDPTNNNGNPNAPGDVYSAVAFGSIPKNIIEFSSGSYLDGCAVPPRPIISHSGDFEPVALATVEYDINTNISTWMAQMDLYQLLQLDSLVEEDSSVIYISLADSSDILNEFKSMAYNSRFQYLADVENKIAKGCYTAAQTALSSVPSGNPQYDGVTGVTVADYSDADFIVSNYTGFYQVLLNYFSNSMSSDDSADVVTLANLCPFTNGEVVYKARAFYSIIYDDGGKWNDDSACIAGFSGHGEFGRQVQGGSQTGASQVQQYSLYPNPNNGNITLQQKIADANPVSLEVLNAEGQSVLKKQLLFMQGLYPLSLQNLSSGLYLIQLRDAAGKSYTLKFIVNSQ